jgi:hypothetical protein
MSRRSRQPAHHLTEGLALAAAFSVALFAWGLRELRTGFFS